MTVSCCHRSRFLLCCCTLVISWREQVVVYWIPHGCILRWSGVLLCNGQVKLYPDYSQQVISNLFIAFMKHGSITYAYYFQTCLLKNPAQYWLNYLSQTVAITDSEIKGSVPFWDLLRADYSWLTHLSISLKWCADSLQWFTCLHIAVVTSMIWSRPSELGTCKDASVKILWPLKVLDKWILAVSLSFLNLDTFFYLHPCASLPCLASLTLPGIWSPITLDSRLRSRRNNLF